MEGTALALVDLLDQLEAIFLDTTRIPFTSSRMVSEQEALEIIEEIRNSIPNEMLKASQINKDMEKYINDTKIKASEIITLAQKKAAKITNSEAVRDALKRQSDDMKQQTKQYCNELVKKANRRVNMLEQKSALNIKEIEQSYQGDLKRLEESKRRERQEILAEHKNLLIQLENERKKAMNHTKKNVEKLAIEGENLINEYKLEATKIRNESNQLKNKTHSDCESLLNNSRREALLIEDGAIKYAESTLTSLEVNIRHLSKVITAGREELRKAKPISRVKQDLTSEDGDRRNVKTRRLHLGNKIRELTSYILDAKK